MDQQFYSEETASKAKLKAAMKNAYDVLRQKYLDLLRVREEIEALRVVIPLLAEERDLVEYGLAKLPSSSVNGSQEQNVAKKLA